LGTHQLRDLPRPERVLQLCHPDVRNDFPPLRTAKAVVSHNLPVQLTSFVGRGAEMTDLEKLLVDNRLVTLTGAGGAGKTRLAVQVAAQMAGEFDDGVWYVDLAPITDPDLVPVTVARALGLPDQPGRSTMDTLLRFVRDRQMLVVLDNCEHLLDASAELLMALLGVAPGLTVLATSREPIGVSGEVSWRVPSLSLADEAIELFADRARRVRPDFAVSDDNAPAVTEICRRLDGLPLAIELAAARVRALSLAEIRDSLHDRFRLLTGGARTAVRRQQTLRASVDWSHALLTEPEQVLFRRLAVFLGGFDLDAAHAVGGGDMQRFHVLDLLTLLVDKSLVVVDDSGGRTRYRLLETVRQYALEKLGESGEADAVRLHHRHYYTALAAVLDNPAGSDYERRLEQAEIEIDNLRAAFGWSHENSDIELALALASSLQPLWQARGRIREGLAWFGAALADLDARQLEVAAAVLARALADRAVLAIWVGDADSLSQAQQALAIAREIGNPALLTRVLTACGYIAGYYDAEAARGYFAEAIGLARASGDPWRLSQILAWQARGAIAAGDPIAARAIAEEGRDLAEAIGDRFDSRQCRWCLGAAQMISGDLAGAAAQFAELVAEAEAAHDEIWRVAGLAGQGLALARQGDTSAARAAAEAAIEAAAELGGLARVGYVALATAALAAGDVDTALDATEAGWQHIGVLPANAALGRYLGAQAALAGGDLIAARQWADDAMSTATGWWLMVALTTRARVAIAQGEPDQGERDAHDALRSLPACKRISVFLTSSSASPLWPARPAVTAKPPAFAARRTPSGSASARSATRSGTRATKPRWRGCEMHWGIRTLTPRGPRARPCPPRRRSPTRSAAAANANAPPAAGARSPPPSATSYDSSAKDSATTTSPHGFSSRRAPCNPISPTSTRSSASPRACSWPKKQPATPEHRRVSEAVPGAAFQLGRSSSVRTWSIWSYAYVAMAAATSIEIGGPLDPTRGFERRDFAAQRRRAAAACGCSAVLPAAGRAERRRHRGGTPA
jgi:predicted ATPase